MNAQNTNADAEKKSVTPKVMPGMESNSIEADILKHTVINTANAVFRKRRRMDVSRRRSNNEFFVILLEIEFNHETTEVETQLEFVHSSDLAFYSIHMLDAWLTLRYETV